MNKLIRLDQMKKSLIYIIISILPFIAEAQTLTNSNLPIVIITTDNNPSTGKPVEIKDDPKVLADMKIVYRPDGSRNYLSDQNTSEFINYNGRIEIEFRGSSSQALPKKPYSLTTLKSDNVSKNNVSILGMSKENDWILNSLAYDPSLMRNYLSYELSRNMGNYAARGVYCEVIINGNYKGLYIFMEKLKIDENRINILKMTSDDNTGSNVTGGYVTKCDKITGSDSIIAWTMGSLDFIHENPKSEEITAQQNTYIHNQFNSLKTTTKNQNNSITSGYPSIIDVPSFIDFILLNEFGSNADAFQYSTYFHKDRNGKLRAGPVWDFDLTFGNDLFCYNFDRSHPDVWQIEKHAYGTFWTYLFANQVFKCYLAKRWIELEAANQPLNYTVISNRIDQLDKLLSEAAVREQIRWNTITNHASNISSLKTWIQTRTDWLNTNLNNCEACSNPVIPALVISKINYHPKSSEIAPSDSLEFIEITNSSSTTVNLSGIYFKELGVTYQFPANSTIGANQKICLASNSSIYKLVYGLSAFGQFSRNLSNNSEKLVLADAFGNVIDQVEYSNSLPWPQEADGNGAYLELANLNFDNNLASSWKASYQTSNLDNISFENAVRIYPTPAKTSITIYGNSSFVKSYEITDMVGRSVRVESNYSSNTINIEQLAPNIYLIKLQFSNGVSVVKKIIKI